MLDQGADRGQREELGDVDLDIEIAVQSRMHLNHAERGTPQLLERIVHPDLFEVQHVLPD